MSMISGNNNDNIFELTPIKLCLLTTIFIVATDNLAFWTHVQEVYDWRKYLVFNISLAFVLALLIGLVIGIISLILPVRLAVSILLLIAAFTGYFSDAFGIIIDTTMIRNALETSPEETFDLLSISLAIRVLLLAALPIALLWWLPFRQDTWTRKLRDLSIIMGATATLILLNILVLSDNYASFFREHKPLRYYTIPTYPIYSVGKFASSVLKPAQDTTFKHVTSYAKIAPSENKKKLIIMVVGETARADRFSLNGYHKETNPLLAQESAVVNFSEMTSCGTSTSTSVPCIFSYKSRENFDVDKAKYIENVVDTLDKAGVSVLWRDNNSSSKGVANRVAFQSFRNGKLNPLCDETECRDIGMLEGLQSYIDQQSGDILIIMHQMGSHGPAYYKRYPDAFKKFTPACQTNELSDCTLEEINNSYDNTILYTDYFLSKVIGFLKTRSTAFDTAMIYVSDHGESLGEKGLYLHGMPYFFAPKEQTHVPFILWAGPSSTLDLEKIRIQKDRPITHSAISFGLLKAFDVQSDAPSDEGVAGFIYKKEKAQKPNSTKPLTTTSIRANTE